MTQRLSGGEMLYGVRAIAAHLGVKPRQALRLVELKRIPHWREGRVICSSVASLSAWLTEREAEAARCAPPGAPDLHVAA